jgi:hypothetical protein
VDDILMIYDENSTDIREVYRAFNSLAPAIKFTMETETDNNINFLDISIRKEGNRFSINIRVYRKPTATDVIIPKNSCHPPEHKNAAIRYLFNKMNSYSLNDDNKKIEHNVIEKILTCNGYETSIIKQFKKPTRKESTVNNKSSWAKFTYF